MDARPVHVLKSRLLRRLQGIFAQEDRMRNESVYVQAAATLILAPYPGATKDFGALLRLVCDRHDLQTSDACKWALKLELLPHDTGEQRTLRKVNCNEPDLFGYCCKQRYTSAVHKSAPPSSQGISLALDVIMFRP